MKQRIALLIIGLALISGYQAFAQKKQTSDYNFRKAIELVDKGDEVDDVVRVVDAIDVVRHGWLQSAHGAGRPLSQTILPAGPDTNTGARNGAPGKPRAARSCHPSR